MSDGSFQPFGPPAGRARGVPVPRMGFAAPPDAEDEQGRRRLPDRPVSDRDFVTQPVLQLLLSKCMARGAYLRVPDPANPSAPARRIPNMEAISKFVGEKTQRGEPTDPSKLELRMAWELINFLEAQVPVEVEPMPAPAVAPARPRMLDRLFHGPGRGGRPGASRGGLA